MSYHSGYDVLHGSTTEETIQVATTIALERGGMSTGVAIRDVQAAVRALIISGQGRDLDGELDVHVLAAGARSIVLGLTKVKSQGANFNGAFRALFGY